MKRRDFLAALGVLGGSALAQSFVPGRGLIGSSQAAVTPLAMARALVLGEVNYIPPASLPTVINVFMYGGPSELAGNLSNIADIDANSQNRYPSSLMRLQADGGQITPNNFWADAGGSIMENLVAAGKMSVYRTINRVIDDSKAHRTSIFSAQVGGLNETAPGMGTTLAAVLAAHHPDFQDPDNPPLLPFVTFEGETLLYTLGDIDLPLPLKSVSLDQNFSNPYSRLRSGALPVDALCSGDDPTCHGVLDSLAREVSVGQAEKFQKVMDAFDKRRELDDFIGNRIGGDPAARVPADTAIAFTNDSFGRNMRAATVLALANPDTRFITLSTGGLGGWDDHDNALVDYRDRMNRLMQNLSSAMRLMETGTLDASGVAMNNPRNDIIINVYGEFGRNVNLNASLGWDHGNNMNLYTLGGAGIGGRQLGKIVGKTTRIGESGVNRQFTTPTADSYQCEPMAIASSVYRYFGVQNPELLTTGEDPRAPNGFLPIDETAPSETLI